jgi:PPP family 3-phenylpropionic acid transporter
MRFLRHLEFGFATRLAALYGAIFVMNGIQLPFLPVWLRAKGLDAQAIGLVLAIPMVVRVFAIAGAARVADRHDALRASIMAACCASALCYALVGASEGVVAIALTYTLASLVMAPVVPLTETYALRGLSSHGKAYGPVRLWGSAAFIAGSFAAGFASDVMPARDLIWLIVGATAVMTIIAVALAPLPPHPPHAEPATQRKSLLLDPVFLAVLAAASLIQSSHAVYYSFSALAWRAGGLEGSTVAGLWALGVIAEIVLFAFSGRLPPALTPPVLIMIGSAGGLLRWGAMAFDPPVALLPWLQLLHALTFGTTYLGALTFVARRAPPGQGATAQGYLAVATGLATAAATGLSGQLYAAYGARAYAAMALAAVAGGACALVADQLGRRVPR